MKVIQAPNIITLDNTPKIFLAGSIEMGTAINWQTQIIKSLEDYDCTIFNPRRDDWDSSWEQKKDNPKFSEQVNWELNSLDHSDIILMYFDPNTKSPISLLELGLYIRCDHLIVCCPEGYWRKGNVDIVCEKYHVKQVDSLEKLIEELRYNVTRKVNL